MRKMVDLRLRGMPSPTCAMSFLSSSSDIALIKFGSSPVLTAWAPTAAVHAPRTAAISSSPPTLRRIAASPSST